MSQIFENIKTQKDAARRTGRAVPNNVIKARILTTLIGELEGNTKGTGKDITDELCLQTIKKFVKAIDETLPLVGDEKRAELVLEKETLEGYLPRQMNDVDLLANIKVIVATQDNPNMGSVMRELKEKFDGRFDGRKASQFVKQAL